MTRKIKAQRGRSAVKRPTDRRQKPASAEVTSGSGEKKRKTRAGGAVQSSANISVAGSAAALLANASVPAEAVSAVKPSAPANQAADTAPEARKVSLEGLIDAANSLDPVDLIGRCGTIGKVAKFALMVFARSDELMLVLESVHSALKLMFFAQADALIRMKDHPDIDARATVFIVRVSETFQRLPSVGRALSAREALEGMSPDECIALGAVIAADLPNWPAQDWEGRLRALCREARVRKRPPSSRGKPRIRS